MAFSPKKLNLFLVFNLPSAYLCGVRVQWIDQEKCHVGVRHKWINKNPFKSMFWAVQGMAAELSNRRTYNNENQAVTKKCFHAGDQK